MATRMSMFPNSVSEWNTLQLQLVSWCIFYYNISRMEDPPPNAIIDDDMELDAFLRSRESKIRTEKIKSQAEAKKRNAGSKQQEIFK